MPPSETSKTSQNSDKKTSFKNTNATEETKYRLLRDSILQLATKFEDRPDYGLIITEDVMNFLRLEQVREEEEASLHEIADMQNL